MILSKSFTLNELTKSQEATRLGIENIPNEEHIENLKILCPNCHSLTPTFGALNKGNGRELRRIKRREKK